MKEDKGTETHNGERYVCTVCGVALFDVSAAFEAGCGFPSFWTHVDQNVVKNPLETYGRSRIQLLCANCRSHLGHLFPNKQSPSGLRYCIAKESIRLA